MSEVASSEWPRSHEKQALGQPEREARQARRQGQNDEGDDESANTDKSADGTEMKQPLEPIPEQLSQVHILIPHLLDDRAHRSVKQAILAFAVEADDVEDPDMADHVGERAEVAGETADMGDRLLSLRGGRRVQSDPDGAFIRASAR